MVVCVRLYKLFSLFCLARENEVRLNILEILGVSTKWSRGCVRSRRLCARLWEQEIVTSLPRVTKLTESLLRDTIVTWGFTFLLLLARWVNALVCALCDVKDAFDEFRRSNDGKNYSGFSFASFPTLQHSPFERPRKTHTPATALLSPRGHCAG